MKNLEGTKDQLLLEKLIFMARTNLSKWLEKIANEFCEEQAVEDRTLVETVKNKLYTDLTEHFLCSLSTFLFKFLIEKRVGHIVEPHPSLRGPSLNPN